MRKLYKFSHCVTRGGFMYANRTAAGCGGIRDKEGLRKCLLEVAEKFGLIDTTIKIYGTIFFLFYMSKPSIRPIDIIESVQKAIAPFGKWDSEYLFSGVYDLGEDYLRRHLSILGFGYDEG